MPAYNERVGTVSQGQITPDIERFLARVWANSTGWHFLGAKRDGRWFEMRLGRA